MTEPTTLMLIAVLAGPVLAVQAQKMIEGLREGRQRKIWVFKTLMATRGTPVSPTHVKALNMIDLEFSGRKTKERAVIEAWRIYLDHLSSGPRDFQDPNYQSQLNSWSQRTQEYLVDLLHTMGCALNYDFDKVQLKKGAYTPQGHSETEFEKSLLRRGQLDILYGKRPLLVTCFQPTQPS